MTGTVVGFVVRVHASDSFDSWEVRCDRQEVHAWIRRADTEGVGLEFQTLIRRDNQPPPFDQATDDVFMDVPEGTAVYGRFCIKGCGRESWCTDPRWVNPDSSWVCCSCGPEY